MEAYQTKYGTIVCRGCSKDYPQDLKKLASAQVVDLRKTAIFLKSLGDAQELHCCVCLEKI